MFENKAATVTDYLAQLPPERRKVVSDMRKLIKQHLPAGYVEEMNWGAITYAIPLSRYPDTYNGQPLCYVALAATKSSYSLYLMGVYGDTKQAAELKAAFKAAGKKLDMGKSCVRFKSPDDLPLDAIGRIVGSVSPDAYIAVYEKSR